MIKLKKIIALNIRNDKPTFSIAHRELVNKAYPNSKGRELMHIYKKFDEISKQPGIYRRLYDHLQGRAFGFWGEVI